MSGVLDGLIEQWANVVQGRMITFKKNAMALKEKNSNEEPSAGERPI